MTTIKLQTWRRHKKGFFADCLSTPERLQCAWNESLRWDRAYFGISSEFSIPSSGRGICSLAVGPKNPERSFMLLLFLWRLLMVTLPVRLLDSSACQVGCRKKRCWVLQGKYRLGLSTTVTSVVFQTDVFSQLDAEIHFIATWVEAVTYLITLVHCKVQWTGIWCSFGETDGVPSCNNLQ